MFKLNISIPNWDYIPPSDGDWRATGVGLSRQSVKDGGISGLEEQVEIEEGENVDEGGKEEEVKKVWENNRISLANIFFSPVS